MKDLNLVKGYPTTDKVWKKYNTEEALNLKVPEKTIYEYLCDCSRDYMDLVAITYFKNKITYRELFENIDTAAGQLTKLGVKQGDIVTMITSNTPETVYYIYAINMIGAISNLEYPTLNEDFIYKEIQLTQSNTVIILDVLYKKFENILKKVKNVIVVSVSDSMSTLPRIIYNAKFKAKNDNLSSAKKSDGTAFVKAPYEKNRTAMIMHSGGTTGIPKGVELTNENINAIALQYRNSGLEYIAGETLMHSIPPFHAFGFSIGIHTPLCAGLNVIGTLKFDEEHVCKMFYKHKPNHFITGGTFSKAILRDKPESLDMSYLKTFAIGGSSVLKEDVPVLNEFLAAHRSKSRLLTGYGMSEFSSAVSNERNDCHKVGSVGVPLPLVNAKVVSVEDGRELKYNEIGELCFNSPSMMKQYYKNQKATDDMTEIDSNGVKWLHTGDCGYIDEDGFIFITGRLKRIYTTMSNEALFKLFPDYVENTVREVAGVEDCAVICVKHPVRKYVPVLYYITSNSDTAELEARIKEHCLKELPEYAQPYEMYTTDSFPLTTVGKINYLELEKIHNGDE